MSESDIRILFRIYGFYDECKRKYSIKLWKTFVDVFNCLPVGKMKLCLHFLILFWLQNLFVFIQIEYFDPIYEVAKVKFSLMYH